MASLGISAIDRRVSAGGREELQYDIDAGVTGDEFNGGTLTLPGWLGHGKIVGAWCQQQTAAATPTTLEKNVRRTCMLDVVYGGATGRVQRLGHSGPGLEGGLLGGSATGNINWAFDEANLDSLDMYVTGKDTLNWTAPPIDASATPTADYRWIIQIEVLDYIRGVDGT